MFEHKVRTATGEDAKTIEHLIGLACEYENLPLSPLPVMPRKIYVAEVDDRVVGMCVVFIQSGEVQLSHLFVLEQHRGHGLGKALLAAVKNSVGSGMNITLFTDPTNIAAMNFFRSNGFRPGRLVNMQMVT
jgi:ribosomal protein S18 acetylase RimI-like enzyme